MKTYTPESVKQLLASFLVDDIKVVPRPDSSQLISMSVEHKNALGHSEYLGIVSLVVDENGVSAGPSEMNLSDKAQVMLLDANGLRITQAFERDLNS